MTVEITEENGIVVLESKTKVVEIGKDEKVGDWVIHYWGEKGAGGPGGTKTKSEAIEYGLSLLGVIDDTDVTPTSPDY